MRLNYAIKFVSDMDAAISFYRDELGLTLLFESPFWCEFDTGSTKLALHPASGQNPAGSVQLGLGVSDLDRFYRQAKEAGMTFTSEPREIHGTRLARFLDPDGAEITVGES